MNSISRLLAIVLVMATASIHAQESQPALRPNDGAEWLALPLGAQIEYRVLTTTIMNLPDGSEQKQTITNDAVLWVLGEKDERTARVGWILLDASLNDERSTEAAASVPIIHRLLLDRSTLKLRLDMEDPAEGEDAEAGHHHEDDDGGVRLPFIAVPRSKLSDGTAWESAHSAIRTPEGNVALACRFEVTRSSKDEPTTRLRVRITPRDSLPCPFGPEAGFEIAPGEAAPMIEAYSEVAEIDLEAGRVLSLKHDIATSFGGFRMSTTSEIAEKGRTVHSATDFRALNDAFVVLERCAAMALSNPVRARSELAEFRKNFAESPLAVTARTVDEQLERLFALMTRGTKKPEADDPRLVNLVGKKAPAFELDDVDGKRVKLADLAGSVVVLSFWGIACPPCRVESPHLSALHEKYGEQGLVVIGVNGFDEPAEKIAAFAKSLGLKHRLLVAGSGVAPLYYVDEYPMTYVIARDGTIRAKSKGFKPGDEVPLDAIVQKLLAEVR